MKSFFISEILLLSQKEKKAKKVLFDRRRTIILGKNNTGKSSLIKSIYWAFGAEPVLHPNFKEANVTVLLKFEVSGKKYEIFRDGKTYTLFDSENQNLIKTFNSVTRELAPYFSNVFNFKPLFQSRNNDFVIPPPSFLFLPFYIDQDNSWNKSWSSFNQLQYLKDPRPSLILYHSGTRPNEYYQTKKELEVFLRRIDELEKERKITNNILSQMQKDFAQVDFNIDINIFKNEVKELLVQCELLKKSEEKLKYTLRDLYSIKATIESQIEIVKLSLVESNSDLEFISKELSSYVDCPTCGAHYENSFAERFDIANDSERCKDLLIELLRDLKEVNDKIDKENSILLKTLEESKIIENILEQRKGELKFKDVIDNYGKNELRSVFSKRIDVLNKDLVENSIKKKELSDQLKGLEDKDRKKEIVEYYQLTLKKFLRYLDVHSIKEESYSSLTNIIENTETGSSRPRALIAYYFAFFYLMAKYSTTTFCPIVIDSPNQQDQDIEHIDKIMNFISDNQPENSQMILGVAELYNMEFNGKIIELNEKYSLLQKDEYDFVNLEMRPYFEKTWLKFM
ncbi:AAA family ATPase [Larkinella punicea]|uniref:Rad50/SbcC-type AAA domain-containing protein n=1 Tax=Larkinella punicea TaxID=2315727 RepID=A0A368JMN1_9BACT|nr:AAA family ATPase [Larkinella punicea]RCR68535.1 hypothetical protein DUE52_15560 [Larkinella punicea]